MRGWTLWCLVVFAAYPSSAKPNKDMALRHARLQVHGHLIPWQRYRAAVVTIQTSLKEDSNATHAACAGEYDDLTTVYASHATCAELLNSLETGQYNATLCSSQCWTVLLKELQHLHAGGCLDLDPAMLSALCSPQGASCSSADATQCIARWVTMGCPDDVPADFRQACLPFAVCAAEARDAGRCNSSPAPTHSPNGATETPAGSPAPAATAADSSTAAGSSTQSTATQIATATVTATSTAIETATPAATTTPSPCKHLNDCNGHGECIDSRCVCAKGYGRRSAEGEEDCAVPNLDLCPDMCNGHGRCVLRADRWVCDCLTGYSGTTCSVFAACKDKSFCGGHGRCVVRDGEERCDCLPGYSGPRCDAIVPCPADCSGRGLCHGTMPANRTCRCDTGFSGATCGTALSACPAGCSGHGVCVRGNCSCFPGFEGPTCAHATLLCETACVTGTCSRLATCQCAPGFYGADCSRYNATADTLCGALLYCSGRGVCRVDSPTGRTCTCFEGFGGDRCEIVESDDKCPQFCSGNGRCVLQPSPHCECAAGWGGIDCSVSRCPIHDEAVCNGHGICDRGAGSTFVCTCDAMWTHGPASACEVALCTDDCNGHGSCSAVGSCVCDAGFGGPTCSEVVVTHSELQDDAQSGVASCPADCSGHGTCQDGVCLCSDGYTGLACDSPPPAGMDDDTVSLNYLEFAEGKDDESKRYVRNELMESRRSMAALWD